MLNTLYPQPNLRLIQFLDGDETLPYHLLQPLARHISQLDQCIFNVEEELKRKEEAFASARMAMEETKMQLRELRSARSKYSKLESTIPPPQLDVLYNETLPRTGDSKATQGGWEKKNNRDRPFIEYGALGLDKRISRQIPLRRKRHLDK
jgi:hypothetical protein